MSVASWHEMDLALITVPDPGWRFDDPVLLEKLKTSLRRHGQVRPVVVRRTPRDTVAVVDGRKLLAAMASLGWPSCMVADIGVVDDESAARMALDLDLFFPTDYAKLTAAVAQMLEAGATPDSLAAASSFSAERIGYMRTIATFDWSQFRDAPEGQTALAWDGAEELPLPVVPAPPDEIDEITAEMERRISEQDIPAEKAAPPPEGLAPVAIEDLDFGLPPAPAPAPAVPPTSPWAMPSSGPRPPDGSLF